MNTCYVRPVFRALFPIAAALATPVFAATFTVTTTADSGAGSLRQAIFDANDAAGADSIVWQAGNTGTLTLTKPLPMITGSVTIDAAAAGGTVIVDGAGLYRAFFVASGTVSISNLTINNARAQGGNGGDSGNARGGGGGGGLGAGAAVFVYTGADVTLTGVTFGNAAAIGGAGGNGDTGGLTLDGGGGGGGLGGNGGTGSGGSVGGGGGGGYAGNGGNAGGGGGGGGGEFGNGGSSGLGGGGGGGQQGNGGNTTFSDAGGGGGGGATANGAAGAGGTGGAGGGSEGGAGGDSSVPGSNAQANLGGGGGGGRFAGGGNGSLSGGGGGAGANTSTPGGNGGVGGGGGGAQFANGGAGGAFGGGGGIGGAINTIQGGAGGFGGGGGGADFNASSKTGGTGGFGGGGGGANIAGVAGAYGGTGGAGAGADGGGGAALGGAVFVATGGALTLVNSAFNGATYSVIAGQPAGTGSVAGAISPATAGQAKGNVMFLQGTAATTISVGNGNTQTIAGGSDGISGDAGVTKSGAGTLILSGTNTYTGATTVSAGTLTVNGSLAAGTTVTVASGATLNGTGTINGSVVLQSGATLGTGLTFAPGASLNLGGNNLTLPNLSGSSNIALGSGTLTVGSDNTSTTYSGVISGTGGVTKVGTGNLNLTGANLYTGATTINAGKLSVNGSLAAGSTVTIATGGTLGGSGTVGGSVAISAGGSIAPGNSIGTLNITGSLTWTGSSTALGFELGAANTSDKIAITGALTKAGSAPYKFDFLGGGTVGGVYTLMTFASTTFSAGEFNTTNLASGLTGTFAIVGGTSLTFTASATPPPGPSKVAATVSLSNLAVTYDGTAKSATITTVPAGLAVDVTYLGINAATTNSAGLPVGVGSYLVSATINDRDYMGTASGTLTIAKATPTITWTAPAAIVYGTALSSTQLNATASTAGIFSYSPASGTVPAAGTQALSVTFTPTDTTNYNSPISATVNLTVNRATPTIAVTPPANRATTAGPLTLAATSSAGLPITYAVLSGPATISGNTVNFSGVPGVVTIQVTQAGNANNDAVMTTLTFSVFAPNALLDVAALGQVNGAQNPLIAGFVVGGTGPKPVLVRGIGPGLTAFGVPGVLFDPILQLFDAKGNLVSSNTVWRGDATLAAAFTQVGAFTLSPTSLDAALVATLQPGSYTAVIFGNGFASGAALAEVYDLSATPLLDQQHLVNLAARGQIAAGGTLTAGFVISGSSPKQILVRGVGPGLSAFGVAGAIADPQLQVMQGGTQVGANDNWSDPAVVTAASRAGGFALVAGSKDAAMMLTLNPGNYTVVVSGVAGATGVVLAEIYEVP